MAFDLWVFDTTMSSDVFPAPSSQHLTNLVVMNEDDASSAARARLAIEKITKKAMGLMMLLFGIGEQDRLWFGFRQSAGNSLKVLIHSAEEGLFWAEVPALPGERAWHEIRSKCGYARCAT